MIIYFIKTILCLALLLLVYLLFLEKEKMHHFNRFYLLFSIVASFGLPFIQLRAPVQIVPIVDNKITFDNPAFNLIEYATDEPALLIPVAPENRPWWPVLLIVLYVSISLILLFRFVRNIVMLAAIIKKSPTVTYAGARLVLTNNQRVPHSFLHYIFLSKTDYENGLVEKEILQHELTHVQQKHSLDILFIEALLIFFWFNPVLYLYRRAIQFNHEFLADDAVVETFKDTVNYQQLLLHYTSRTGSILFTSPFNFPITKKRFIMMTRNTSPKIAIAKQIAMLPFLAAIVLLFSTKVTGQQNTGKPGVSSDTTIAKAKIHLTKNQDSLSSPWVRFSIGSTKEGVTPELLAEYNNIINKYETEDKWWQTFSKRVSEQDRNRMETIFKQMNFDQQRKQFLIFIKPAGALPRVVPTPAQFEAFKNPKVYGVWIDDNHVGNTALNNHKNIDFVQFTVSKLYGSAKQGRSYTHQLNMMTRDYYESYYNQTMANNRSNIAVVMDNHPVDSIRQKFRSLQSKANSRNQLQTGINNNAHLFEPTTYGPGASPQMLNEYDSTLRQMTTIKMQKNGKISETTDMSKGNVDRLGEIFYLMSKEQKEIRIKATGFSISPTLKFP